MLSNLTHLCVILLVCRAAIADEALDVSIVVGGEDKLTVPFGVGFDKAGNTYIVELDGMRVKKLDAHGELTVLAGDGTRGHGGDGGPAANATVNGTHNVAVTPDGDLYIADTWNNCVRKIDHKTGVITTIAGDTKRGFAGDGGPAVKARFGGVFCVTLNATHDKLYIADLGNRRIRMIDLKTGVIDTIAGNGKKGAPKDGANATDSPLVDPRAVTVDSKGNVYILERSGHALRVVSADGRIRTVAGTGKKGRQDGPGRQASLNGPKHLCVDRRDNVIIADAENNLIRKYDVKTGVLSTLPIKGLARPHGVAVRSDGALFVVDSYHHRILKVTGAP